VAVSRREAENRLAASELAAMRHIENELDKAITERWQGSGDQITVSLSIGRPLRQAARDKLVGLYRAAGWEIRFDDPVVPASVVKKDGHPCSVHVTAFSEPEQDWGQGRWGK
jgi:hypothetical protein